MAARTGWEAWTIGAVSLIAMFLNAPARIVVIVAGVIGVVFLS
jgi:hypothetical protein